MTQSRVWTWWVCALFLPAFAQARIEFQAREYSSILSTGEVEARGAVKIWEGDQEIYADEITFHQKTGEVHARGNVVVRMKNQTMFGREIRYNFNTRRGKLSEGGIEVGGQVQVTGSTVEKVDHYRYVVRDGTYTTCLNCPRSWYFSGTKMDITYEGYAFIDDAVFVAGDLPLGYFPKLIFPIKVKRQSGLVDPRYDYSAVHGFDIGLSYFWALDRSYDATFGYDWLSRRGHLASVEGRWVSSPFSHAQTNGFFLYDTGPPAVEGSTEESYRGALETRILERFGSTRVSFFSQFASDRTYTLEFGHLADSRGQPALKTELIVDRPIWRGLLTGAFTHFQDIQIRSPQVVGDKLARPPLRLPMIAYDIPSLPLWWDGGKGFRGLSLSVGTSVVNYSSLGTAYLNVGGATDPGAFDSDDFILSGQRATVEPRLTLPIILGDHIFASTEVVSRTSVYALPSAVTPRTAQRQEIELFNRTGIGVENIFPLDDKGENAMKHSVDLYGRYRYTPFLYTSESPLFNRVRGLSGFDDEDTQIEKHRAGYEIQQRLIRKSTEGAAVQYANTVTWITEQDYDFLTDTEAWLPLKNRLSIRLDQVQAEMDIATSVYTWDSNVTAALGYTPVPGYTASIGVRSRTGRLYTYPITSQFTEPQAFDWSVGLRAKLLYGFAAETHHNYSQTRKRLLEESYRLSYFPDSKCWHMAFQLSRTIERPGWAVRLNFTLETSEASF